MKDIEIAKKYLYEENLTIAVVKDEELLFKSTDKGIKPIYTIVTTAKEKAEGASIADRVIGKGAALLCKHIGIKEVYGELLSNSAMKVLDKANILYSCKKACPYIKNRDKTDYCPIEKIATGIEDIGCFLDKLERFLKNTK